MGLREYDKKRDFSATPEPTGGEPLPSGRFRFVVQRHQARRLHYDLRLEIDGVLKSWAVPKGPSMNPEDKRLAVRTEDHPVTYLDFEGTIPKGNYGAGDMAIWDRGTFSPQEGENEALDKQLSRGNMKLTFHGSKLRGSFALVRTKGDESKEHWLLIKKSDEFSTHLDYDAEDLAQGEDEGHETKEIELHKLVKPMLATQGKEIFDSTDWIYEIKWDGYRALAQVSNGKVHLYSRNGISFNQKFYPITKNLSAIAHDVLLDGEIVIVGEDGMPNFQLLQNYSAEVEGELRYYVFDVLYLNGHDTISLPLLDRKSLISDIIDDVSQVHYCDHVEGLGKAFYEKVISMGLEGVIAKKADSTYSPGYRTESWVKIKSKDSQEALICGYTESKGSLFGSLILGAYYEGELLYIGNCGSGFSNEEQKKLLIIFEGFERKKSPFSHRVNLGARKAVWLEPEIICEVQFSQWTSKGLMRHPVYKGLRADKMRPEIMKQEVSAATLADSKKNKTSTKSSEDSLEVGGLQVAVSNLDKIYWLEEKITKFDLLAYYIEISEHILPFLVDRPQNLHRHPEGIAKESFYQKDITWNLPDWIEQETIYSSSSEKNIDYMLCQNEASLIYMANLGCIELNPWNSKRGALDYPDYAILDLDPSEKNSFDEVIEVAQMAHAIMDEVGLKHYCKTSGSSGLHIYVPLGAQYTYDEARDFIKLFCHLIHEEMPKLTSMERAKNSRKDKIYLDYLQNRRGQTLAAPYCVRPKAGATVSAPLTWDEVEKGLKMQDFTIFTMPKRIKEKKGLFTEILDKGIDMEKILGKMGV